MAQLGEIRDVESPQERDETTVHISDTEHKAKNRRRQLKGKITRSINRLNDIIRGEENNPRRIKRILTEIREDYQSACEVHGELYNYVDDSEKARLDAWETELTNEVYDIENKAEDYIQLITLGDNEEPRQGMVTRGTKKTVNISQNLQPVETTENVSVPPPGSSPLYEAMSEGQSNNGHDPGRQTYMNINPPDTQTFDSWIDFLIEFSETVFSNNFKEITISEALFKLEATKDIPTITLDKYDGNPLGYVDFIERFRIHIHNKPHLTDDIRMLQLRMHLTGDAERAIIELGSSGIMYATVLKSLKEQFGQRSCIARACLKRLRSGKKINNKDRVGLRDFSIDIINCISVFHRIGYYSDVNSTEALRQIISRLPDYLITKWKSVATDIRAAGQIPTIKQVSDFVRKRVKAEFDPDFGDIETGIRSEIKGKSSWDKKKVVYSTQPQRGIKCFICEKGHRVSDCQEFKDSSVNERYQYAKEKRLCFSCLNKGHMTSDCRSKRKCDQNGCSRTHHSLLHSEPISKNGVASILDRDGILPVIRVSFRSANGRKREGNVLIDSGAGTTVIRRDFAKSLGLQGKTERFDISVVGGETVKQSSSRRLKFWISPLEGGGEHMIEAHDIDRTILDIPALNRSWLKTHPHLSDLDFPHKAGPVDLILGVQYSHLHIDENVRQGLPFQPVAKKTQLGWYVMGSDSTRRVSSVCSIGLFQKMDLEKFYSFETMGIQAPDCECPTKGLSLDDRRTLTLFEESCHLEGSRYSIGLPWKCDPLQLPDNYPLAEKRLISLERSLSRDSTKAKMYTEAIHEYIDNDWAEQLTETELNTDIQPVFYLPHHGVYRHDKKSTPLRVVFDPACFYKGVSLNSLLHKGPCLVGNLLGVLLRFREQEVAFLGDISKMYLQILLPESDTQVGQLV